MGAAAEQIRLAPAALPCAACRTPLHADEQTLCRECADWATRANLPPLRFAAAFRRAWQ